MLRLMTNSFVWLFFILSQVHGLDTKKRELHIGGIFPISGTEGWQGGVVSDLSVIRLFIYLLLNYFLIFRPVNLLR